MRKGSLRFRLCLYFTLFLVAGWLVAAFFAWRECRAYVDEFFDTQQLLFARTLAIADWQAGKLPGMKEVFKGVDKELRGEHEDDALSFAVFDKDGRLFLSSDEKSEKFVFIPGARGFLNSPLRGSVEEWRILWMPSQDGRHIIAVGQEMEFRNDLVGDMLSKQLMPWLLLLLFLIVSMLVMTTREFKPLKTLANRLRRRQADDVGALPTDNLPSEVAPLVLALNSLFERIGRMMEREKAFVADAAHELRTPLAALKVQAEVAAMQELD